MARGRPAKVIEKWKQRRALLTRRLRAERKGKKVEKRRQAGKAAEARQRGGPGRGPHGRRRRREVAERGQKKRAQDTIITGMQGEVGGTKEWTTGEKAEQRCRTEEEEREEEDKRASRQRERVAEGDTRRAWTNRD